MRDRLHYLNVGSNLQRCPLRENTSASSENLFALAVDATDESFSDGESTAVETPQQVATRFPIRKRVAGWRVATIKTTSNGFSARRTAFVAILARPPQRCRTGEWVNVEETAAVVNPATRNTLPLATALRTTDAPWGDKFGRRGR